jgi:methionyl aminopeptidase
MPDWGELETSICGRSLTVRPVPIVGLDRVQVSAPHGAEAQVRRFYGELLGLAEIEKPPALRERGGVCFELGRQQLHVGIDAGPRAPGHQALLLARPVGQPHRAARGWRVRAAVRCGTMSADTPQELRGLQRAGRVVAAAMKALRKAVRPGVTTGQLDALAAEFFTAHGARSGPILTYRYPGSICISVDDEVVHGVPGARTLKPGQLVTLDVAAEVDGFHADAAVTVPVGPVDADARRLMAATRAALDAGMRAAQPGATLRDVGGAVEHAARSRGFRVFRELTGHGIGRAMHEAPTVVNWPAPDATQVLTPGLVFTIEPMISSGSTALVVGRDGWTIRSVDGSRSAHEEHTIMVSEGGPVVLTAGR